tara:strand:- start:453 stop:704 length:252 start_codon:yes stop_codon:yes gene_type:complete
MGNIFKKDKTKKAKAVPAKAPEEPETKEEIEYTEKLSEESGEEVGDESKIAYREIPVCMSQVQINNLVIENNIMLKQILSNSD